MSSRFSTHHRSLSVGLKSKCIGLHTGRQIESCHASRISYGQSHSNTVASLFPLSHHSSFKDLQFSLISLVPSIRIAFPLPSHGRLNRVSYIFFIAVYGETPSLLFIGREPFEHGLLPRQSSFSPIYANPNPLKAKLLELSSNQRVKSAAISEASDLPAHAGLVLDTLASVLHYESNL
ncbi:hypothetical protein K1719_039752 [Acacia pycnantha]|nr:hypothetical protein K1719_039752 [Acacia pycnantha]